MKCTNNLKQIGLSLHNYHDVYNSFPGSRMGNGSISMADWGVLSMNIALLPFAEQQQRYETIKQVGRRMFYVSDSDPCANPWPNSGNMFPATVEEIPYLRCPSSPTFMRTQGFYNSDTTCAVYTQNMTGASTPRDGVALTAAELAGDFKVVSRGVAETSYAYCVGDAIACTQEVLSSDRGVFSSGKYQTNSVKIKGINSITDGTTNTLAYSELLNTNSFNYEGSTNFVMTQSYYGGYGCLTNTTLTVANCLATYDASAKQFKTGQYIYGRGGTSTAQGGRYSRGGRWTCGHTGMSGFNTVMPPNSPNCAAAGEGCSQAGFYNAQSAHPGGVNALRCDGSVIFVSSSIDCGNQNYYDPTVAATDWISHGAGTVPPTEMLSGQSPYGIWGAMGTPAGGESKSL